VIYELDIYIQFKNENSSELINTTSPESQTYNGELPSLDEPYTVNYIATHTYHHFLYGLGMIAGAILLASVKDRD